MGDSWAGPVSLGPGKGFLPRVGPNGELYVAYWDFAYGVLLRRSFNGGQTFGPPITIATRMDSWDPFVDCLQIPGLFRVLPLNYLAVDQNNGTLYCVYFDTTNVVGGNSNVDLYFTKSTTQGLFWTTPVVINGDANPPGDQFFPWIEVDADSNLHMVFLDSRHTVQDDDAIHGMFDAYYSFSNDGGATWQEFRLTSTSFDSYNDGLHHVGDAQFLGDYLGLGRGRDRVYPCYLATSPSGQNGDSNIYTHVVTILGGCCLADSCSLVSRDSCASQGGTFLGAGKICSSRDCNENGLPDECDAGGACCLSGIANDCIMTPTSACCDAANGLFWYGLNSTCATTDCSEGPMRPQQGP